MIFQLKIWHIAFSLTNVSLLAIGLDPNPSNKLRKVLLMMLGLDLGTFMGCDLCFWMLKESWLVMLVSINIFPEKMNQTVLIFKDKTE